MGFIDWQPLLEEIITREKPKVLVEFGLGDGTAFLVRHVEKVYSVELLANPEHEGWFEKVQEQFENIPSWKGYLYRCSDEYTPKLKNYINLTIGRIKPDMVFVDPGIHCRGEIVSQMMDREIPIIAAHDTNQGYDENDIYGWNKINKKGYTAIKDGRGEGTTVWTKV